MPEDSPGRYIIAVGNWRAVTVARGVRIGPQCDTEVPCVEGGIPRDVYVSAPGEQGGVATGSVGTGLVVGNHTQVKAVKAIA